MRRTALAIATIALIAGCGGGKSESTTQTTSTSARPARPAAPRYVPSARHAHRPPGSVYDDEIGENILTATYSRVIELFGPPASTKGDCIRYRIVGRQRQQWQFCFKNRARMTSATVVQVR